MPVFRAGRAVTTERKTDMIPSDHFVMFYNEIFKYLVRQGDAVL